jgi:hypothetical protein
MMAIGGKLEMGVFTGAAAYGTGVRSPLSPRLLLEILRYPC